MRRYYLASAEKRGIVDLREYQDEIVEAVHQFAPQTKVVVTERHYDVDPSLPRGIAIKVGRILSSRDILGKYCIPVPKLFCSEEVGKGMVNVNGRKKKRTGGHQ